MISTGRRTGRAELDEHAEGVHYTEIDVDFRRSKRSREAVLSNIRARLGEIPGVFVNIGQPISHRLDHLLSGVQAQIAVKLFGNDLDQLRARAAEIQAAMATVPGVVDLQTEKQVLVPQVRIEGDRAALARYGLNIGDLNEALETALDGRVVSQVLEGQRTFDLLVRFDDASRGSLDAIRNALIDTPSGAKVPLSVLAAVEDSRGPNVIQHENVQRRIVVSANVSGRDLGRVVEELQKKVGAQVTLPTGYFITYGGQFEIQQSATRLIGILSLFSLASLVGFITLTGIASRNTIMMISHYLHLMKEEGEAFALHMVVRGSLERLVPVLMTALTAGLALIPLVLSNGEPGKEILHPVATVILGGLIGSTLLDMIVTPAVFSRFGRKSAEKYLAGNSDPS